MGSTDMHPQRTGAPQVTLEEIHYLRRLVEQRTPVRVRLRTNEEVEGVVEYYDKSFIRLTREDAPNLFLFKHDIKYLMELEPGG